MFLRESCWDTADATLVAKTSSGEGRDRGSERSHCYRYRPKNIFLPTKSAKDTDETDKWGAGAAGIGVALSSEVLRNTVVFVVPESTPGDTQAVLPNKMSGFIKEITESEISPVDWGVQVSKTRGQKMWWPISAFFFFLMQLEIQEKLLICLCLIWVRKI